MSAVGRHNNLPFVVERPRTPKKYDGKLEAELVVITNSFVSSFGKSMLLNRRNLSNSEMTVSNGDRQSSSTGQQLSEYNSGTRLFLACLTPDKINSLRTLLRALPLVEVNYFRLNTSSDLPLPKNFKYSKTIPEVLCIVNIDKLLADVSLLHAMHQPNPESAAYTRYELKQIWFYLKSQEIFSKIEEFELLQASASIQDRPKESLYWLFKIYHAQYWLAISYCYAKELNVTATERTTKICCKMAEELTNRERIYKNTEVTEETIKTLCIEWHYNNKKLEDLMIDIYDAGHNAICKWRDRTPQWILKIFIKHGNEE